MSPIVVLLIVTVIVIIVLVMSYTKVPKGYAYILERNGSFQCVWECGVHFKVPFIDMVVKKVSLEQLSVGLRPKSFVTKDGESLQIEAAVFYNVYDAQKYAYAIDNGERALEKLATEMLKSVSGSLETKEMLSSADSLSSKLTGMLSQAADIWGIKVQRFVFNDIIK